MRWYLGGPMTGLPEFNFPEFERVAGILRDRGMEIVSAHEVDHGETPETVGTTKTHGEYLKTDIGVLCTCDGVIFLPNWPNSKGASAEFNVAVACQMPILIWQPRTASVAPFVYSGMSNYVSGS